MSIPGSREPCFGSGSDDVDDDEDEDDDMRSNSAVGLLLLRVGCDWGGAHEGVSATTGMGGMAGGRFNIGATDADGGNGRADIIIIIEFIVTKASW